jgi:hypothetical protein
MTTSTSAAADGMLSAGAVSSAAELARKERRLSLDMVSEFFPANGDTVHERKRHRKFHG